MEEPKFTYISLHLVNNSAGSKGSSSWRGKIGRQNKYHANWTASIEDNKSVLVHYSGSVELLRLQTFCVVAPPEYNTPPGSMQYEVLHASLHYVV